MPHFDVAIFDLDGTLLNTIHDVAVCFNEALERCGFPVWPVEEYPSLVGGDLEAIVARLLPAKALSSTNVALVKRMYQELYAASEKPFTAPYPGIPQLLGRLECSGMVLAVNTNKGQTLAEACMARYLPMFVGDIVGYDDSHPSKPDPWGVRRILLKTGAPTSRAIYIGDGETDLQTARNAGMAFTYAAWGGDVDAQIASKADYVCKSVDDLESYLMGDR